MKVIQEKLPASQIGLQIEIPSEVSKKAYERVVQEFTRSVNVPGFRKGKVPRQVLIQQIGSSRLKAAAVEELVEDSIKEAVKQENIEALGNFQLRSSFEDLVSQFDPMQPLTFSASVDVQPSVVLTQYSGLQIQAEEIKPDPKQIEAALQQYREQMATLVPVEGRTAQMADVAVVDFKGVLRNDDPEQEPEPVPGGEAQGFQLELTEGQFIPGFIDGIVGMNPGDMKDVQATFPETYPQPDVAGRDAVFAITLKELKEKEFPELDDEFAQDASDGEFQTLAELQASLETKFKQEAENKTKSNKEQAVLDELLNHVEVDIPETLIEREVTFMINQTAMQLQNQGIDVRQLFTQDMVARLRDQSRPDATQRIKRTLAMGEVAKQESIQVQPDELATKVAELLKELEDQNYDQPIDQERMQAVVSEDLLKEKIVDWLIDHSTVELVPAGTLTKEDADVEELAEESTEVAETAQESAVEVSDVNELAAKAEPTTKNQQSTQSTDASKAEVEVDAIADISEAAEHETAEKTRKSAKKSKPMTTED
ncbi:trigger factor [Phormidium sp. CLA17]|uniref:trigger factor n=1 Tax=Leptolyngbya sp. Cla-17 TaxID=2803751 RepID=UPI001491603A|nr:trigger factor [Leptolyngbya sp. Cla-17]MBM0741048.1 trigger factor [Leptolyngbya sp. Cla-17]